MISHDENWRDSFNTFAEAIIWAHRYARADRIMTGHNDYS